MTLAIVFAAGGDDTCECTDDAGLCASQDFMQTEEEERTLVPPTIALIGSKNPPSINADSAAYQACTKNTPASVLCDPVRAQPLL